MTQNIEAVFATVQSASQIEALAQESLLNKAFVDIEVDGFASPLAVRFSESDMSEFVVFSRQQNGQGVMVWLGEPSKRGDKPACIVVLEPALTT